MADAGPEVRFYHLTKKSLDQALPELLQRCLDRGWRSVVMTSSGERAAYLSNVLWTSDPASFLPHGTQADGRPESQPIWVTDKDENPNKGSILFLSDGVETQNPTLFEMVCVLFDGLDPDALHQARRQWSMFKEKGFSLAYWAQDEAGRWAKKMET